MTVERDLKQSLKEAIEESADDTVSAKVNQIICGDKNIIVGGDFNGRIIQLQKHVKNIIVKTEPGEKHITEEQMLALKELIHEAETCEGRIGTERMDKT